MGLAKLPALVPAALVLAAAAAWAEPPVRQPDISALAHVEAVVKGGVVYRREAAAGP